VHQPADAAGASVARSVPFLSETGVSKIAIASAAAPAGTWLA
jgi:hypothetical protein